MNSLEERIALLEKSNRRWRACVGLLTLAAIGMAAARPGTGVSDLVRVRRLEIINQQDEVVAHIAPSPGDDGGEIYLVGSREKGRIILSARQSSGAYLFMYDEEGKSVASATAQRGAGMISAKNSKKGTQTDIAGSYVGSHIDRQENLGSGVMLRVNDVDRSGRVSVYNSLANVVAAMEFGKDNSGVITVNDPDGNIKDALIGK